MLLLLDGVEEILLACRTFVIHFNRLLLALGVLLPGLSLLGIGSGQSSIVGLLWRRNGVFSKVATVRISTKNVVWKDGSGCAKIR